MAKNKKAIAMTEIKTKKDNNQLIVQSNEVTEAAYHLSIKAKRVLWLCLAQAYQSDSAKEGTFFISVHDYQHYFEVGKVTASKDVKLGVDELLRNYVTFYPTTGDYEEISRPWLLEQARKVERGIFKLEFNPRLVPYVTGLSEKFTQFYLQHCGKLNNSRTIRLYESLCQWRNTGVWRVDVAWLIERYDLPATQATNYAELKRKFLVPAVARINDKTPINVTFKEITGVGNKVTAILFNMTDSAVS